MIAHMNVHSSRTLDLVEPDQLRIEPAVEIEQYQDSFGNLASRFLLPPGRIRLHNSFLIEDAGGPDSQDPRAEEVPVDRLPAETLRYLLASHYCEVDLLLDTATESFGNSPRGWGRVQVICDWVNQHVAFGYEHARLSKTTLEVYNERLGVRRDFQHLAVTFCRCLNIPARYATGYLGDIRGSAAAADGFQRLVRGFSRRSLVHVRRQAQCPAHRSSVDSGRTRCH
jgi:transglutaminase-like putative cysteine protease